MLLIKTELPGGERVSLVSRKAVHELLVRGKVVHVLIFTERDLEIER